ncbi:hypothetical protein [Ottowia testudinis]|uniref:Uncharacterized protein n=1 Tax=Ottowia testudinis TaxID=2816950 RepID=A0A975H692_9BURK|nr:hypothetical protein [Ottowia testudinis]QTD45767.1 hypothetical protein J1M35_02275 [Ottowia testudinis]
MSGHEAKKLKHHNTLMKKTNGQPPFLQHGPVKFQIPFGLSLSKPEGRLSGNGSNFFVPN